MGSDHVVGPLFVHPLCGYGAKRLCSRSPAYPCPPGPPSTDPERGAFKALTGLMAIIDPPPKWGLGVTA